MNYFLPFGVFGCKGRQPSLLMIECFFFTKYNITGESSYSYTKLKIISNSTSNGKEVYETYENSMTDRVGVRLSVWDVHVKSKVRLELGCLSQCLVKGGCHTCNNS